MSTANEQPGSGMPEEPVESDAEGAEPGQDAVGGAEAVTDTDTDTDPDVGLDGLDGLDVGLGAGLDVDLDAGLDAPAGADAAAEAAESDGEETEEQRLAREQIEFDKLVVAFHGESAPDPQGRRPEAGTGAAAPTGPHKIIRYPVLAPRPEWEGSIVEPTDETTADPLDYIEHYEPPDPELPQASAATLASWTMLIGGVAFLVLHTLLGWQTPEYLGWLAIIGVFGGIVTLVARMKPDRDEYDDPDNGAVV